MSTPGFDRELWRGHCNRTAEAAEIIAARLDGMDPEQAFVCGLLHDIGKCVDPAPKRHSIAGYRYLNDLGYTDCARTALTHDFPVIHADSWRREGLLTDAEIAFVVPILNDLRFDLYDWLIQVCDVISLPDGWVLMEKRMLRAAMRYGCLSESLSDIIRASDENIRTLNSRLGRSIYSLLPGVVEHSFGM